MSGDIDANTGSSLYSRVGMIHMSIPSRVMIGPSSVSKRFLIHGVTRSFCSRCVSTRCVGSGYLVDCEISDVRRATASAVAELAVFADVRRATALAVAEQTMTMTTAIRNPRMTENSTAWAGHLQRWGTRRDILIDFNANTIAVISRIF